MKITNLVYIFNKEGRLLLAMKKRSHGVGKWNGPGGKVKEGESIEEAAKREVFEEVGLTVDHLEPGGWIEFIYDDPTMLTSRCYLFRCREFSGTPTESDEMRPQWFDRSNLPWETMWESDKIWLNDFLNGKEICLQLHFDKYVKLKS